jgi:hypothetical protein
VNPDFRNQIGSGDSLDPRNGEAEFDGPLTVSYLILNADVQFCDLPVQKVKLLALQSQHPAMVCGVRGEFTKSRGNQRLVQPATVLLPAIRGKPYRRRRSARIWQPSC